LLIDSAEYGSRNHRFATSAMQKSAIFEDHL